MTDVKPGRRQMYAALTRGAVLDAARALFVEKGFDATSVDEIARLSQVSKGAVYHHFGDKQEIFAEIFRSSQEAVMRAAFETMAQSGEPWDVFQAATRAFLRSYAAEDDARALLRQAISALGWDRIRALDEQMALPFLRATLEHHVQTGVIRPIPVDAAAELLFSLYCNAVLFIADATDPEAASNDIETVIFSLLGGLRTTTDER